MPHGDLKKEGGYVWSPFRAKADVDHEMKKSFEFGGVSIRYELKHAYSKRNRTDFIFCFITRVSCQSVIYIKPSPFRSWRAKFGTRKYQVSKSIHYKKHVNNACWMFIEKWRHRAWQTYEVNRLKLPYRMTLYDKINIYYTVGWWLWPSTITDANDNILMHWMMSMMSKDCDGMPRLAEAHEGGNRPWQNVNEGGTDSLPS